MGKKNPSKILRWDGENKQEAGCVMDEQGQIPVESSITGILTTQHKYWQTFWHTEWREKDSFWITMSQDSTGSSDVFRSCFFAVFCVLTEDQFQFSYLTHLILNVYYIYMHVRIFI